MESVANQDLAALPENYRKVQEEIRALQERYEALIDTRVEEFDAYEQQKSNIGNALSRQLPFTCALENHQEFGSAQLKMSMAELQCRWDTVQRDAMAIIQSKTFPMKKSRLPFGKDYQSEIPRFPLSLFQQSISPVLAYYDSQVLTADKTIEDSSQNIKVLVNGTKKPGSTGAPVCDLVSRPSFRLSISRPMIPANIIAGLNSISDIGNNVAKSFIPRLSSLCLKSSFTTYSKQLRAIAWRTDSPFMAWRRFIRDLKFEHLSTSQYSAHKQWLGDLQEVKQSDPMPLPIYKSVTTGDYWVFGWHGTPKADNFYQLGFKMMVSNEDGLYGRGHYTAIESSKSFTYAAGRRIDPNFFRGDMLICASNFGKDPALLINGILSYKDIELSCQKSIAHLSGDAKDNFDKLLANNELSDKDKEESVKKVIRQPFLRLAEQIPKIVVPSGVLGSGFGGGRQEQYEFITPIPPTIILKISAA